MLMMPATELAAGVIHAATGSLVAVGVYRLVQRIPWPRPFRLRYAAVHVVMAPLAATTWYALSNPLESLLWHSEVRNRWPEFMVLGMFFYAIVAGVAHAVEASARATRAETIAARTQLAALRAQLHPHFLFNALHTVVQLIPIEPKRAAEAAELVGDLLRATLDENRDEVTVADEWTFVSRYLELERIRFGDRLVVQNDLKPDVLDECIPAFALQTLVENAVHHGAAPRVAATEIVVTATGTRSEVSLSVRNTADASLLPAAKSGPGTSLTRLRERIAVLYGTAAQLTTGPTRDGFEAVLVVPRHHMSKL